MKKSSLLLINLAIPLLAGFLSYLLSGRDFSLYETIKQPPLSPPGIVFFIVWTILYVLMGISTYLVLNSNSVSDVSSKKESALILYGIQLIVNVLWSPVFFRLNSYFGAFVILVILWFFVYKTYRAYSEINSLAGKLFLPYLLWCTFAIYLNFGIVLLN